ncbi:hypothetical protein FSARC_10163 [Fusarium sarcochroum]|uniref:Uncharacterized protein n=1 Tax=Fusarium sarcochroum TaxID=1208366 RepID=A0A8H4X4V5_9HYPO|nr:hypothetical protein FSARC_10163 [Fusarium sarcochroum]
MSNYPAPSFGDGLPYGQDQMNALMGNEDRATFQEANYPASIPMNETMGAAIHSSDAFNADMIPQQFVGNEQQVFAQPVPTWNPGNFKFWPGWVRSGLNPQIIDKLACKFTQDQIDSIILVSLVLNEGQTGDDQSQAHFQAYAQAQVHAPQNQMDYAGHGNHPAHVPGSFNDNSVGLQSENGSDHSASTTNTASTATSPSGDEDEDEDEETKAAQAAFRARPAPDHNDRDARNRYLVDGRACKLKYGEIIEKGGFKVSASTLRGRHRTLTKAPEDRLRSPPWTRRDYLVLQELVWKYVDDSSCFSWSDIADEMWEVYHCSYKYCAATVAKAARQLANKPNNGHIPADGVLLSDDEEVERA